VHSLQDSEAQVMGEPQGLKPYAPALEKTGTQKAHKPQNNLINSAMTGYTKATTSYGNRQCRKIDAPMSYYQ